MENLFFVGNFNPINIFIEEKMIKIYCEAFKGTLISRECWMKLWACENGDKNSHQNCYLGKASFLIDRFCQKYVFSRTFIDLLTPLMDFSVLNLKKKNLFGRKGMFWPPKCPVSLNKPFSNDFIEFSYHPMSLKISPHKENQFIHQFSIENFPNLA